ncbi:MAG: hypothetical protein KDB69_05115 [Acidimicrobiia bacterium]|nr:hypothetical protein [Acidimicrobiia bacterium]
MTEDTVTAAFTAGWPVKQVAVRDITAVEAVRNTWWYGWGIRWIPNDGTMYNVSGLDAVRLEIEGSKPFRIGTDDPRGLVEAVRSAGRIPD